MKDKISYLYRIAGMAAFSGFTSNFSMSAMTPAIPFLIRHFKVGATLLGLMVSSLAIGAMAGALLTSRLPDRIGRRNSLKFAAWIFLAASCLSALSITPYDLILYRIMTGFAVGMTSVAAPMYLAEIAPPEKRGITVSLYQLAIVVGILFSYFSGYIFSHSSFTWRLMLGMAAVPSGILLVLLSQIPESPHWLAGQNRKEQSIGILEKIGGKAYAGTVIQHMSFSPREENRSVSFRLFFQKSYLKVLLAGSVLTVIQQWSGTNIIFSYSPVIYESAGFSTAGAVSQTIFIGLINLLFTLLSFPLIQQKGRKSILLGGLAVNFLTLMIAGIYFHAGWHQPFLLVAVFLFCVASFAATLGPVTWIVISEISPAAIRSQAMSVFVCCLWLAGMAGTFSFPLLDAALGTGRVFFLYALLCLFSMVFIALSIPETRNKSLEEIEKLWHSRK